MAAGKLIDTSVLTANLFMSIALLVGMILTGKVRLHHENINVSA